MRSLQEKLDRYLPSPRSQVAFGNALAEAVALPIPSAEFEIRAVPTFILLDKGQKKAQLTGARSKKDFEKWLSEN